MGQARPSCVFARRAPSMAQFEPNRSAVAAAMVCSAAVSAQFVAGKATRDALFLANLDVTALPAMVAVTAAVSIGLVALSSSALRRITPEALMPAAFAASGALFALDWLAVDRLPIPVAWAVYLQVSGVGPLLGSGFWLLATERFDPRSARRYFGQIAGVGTLAGLAGALVSERVGAIYGVTAMLPVLAALNVLCAVALQRLVPNAVAVQQRLEAMDNAPELSMQSPQSGLRALAHAPYLQNLAALVFLGTVAATLADYVFKASAVESLGNGAALLRFFAVYYAGVSLLAFLVQTTASTIALERLGLGLTSSTPSLALGLGAVVAMAVPGLQAAMMARAGESVFRASLFKTVYEIFFTPISPHDKRAAKSIIDVGFDRLGDMVGGGLIALLLVVPIASPLQLLMAASALCSAVGLLAALRLSRGYIRTLEQSLVSRALDLDLGDATDVTTRTSMLRTLRLTSVSGGPASLTGLRAPAAPEPAVSDPEIQEILALRSRNVPRVRAVLREGDGLPATLVPHVIPLLAWDPVSDDAVRALQGVAEERVGELIDALVDPNQPFAVRRRLARVFSVCVSQRAADGLMLGLEDLRFEVRFHCGRSLAALVEKNALLKIDGERVFGLIRREVAVSRPVWESHRLLDQVEGDHFADDFVKRRAGQSLAHVFTLLSVVLPTVPLQLAYRGLQTEDTALRGTALEYLEGVLPRDIRERLFPFLDSSAARPGPARDRDQVLAELLRSNESIMMNLQEVRRRARASAPEGH
jgi:AAA family ATP:ADP antiporter